MNTAPFLPLAERIEQIPYVICGPILRRADENGITVWLALRKKVNPVALFIFEDNQGEAGEIIAFGSEASTSFGENLHIVAVTAISTNEDKPLTWGKSYLYDLSFDFEDEIMESLDEDKILGPAGSVKKITYGDYDLPGFRLPPKDVSKLHFIQGSCRNVAGHGLDAMQAIDKMLGDTWETPQRPQQLFLTGDQIYADEVDDTLLHMLTDASQYLLNNNDKEKEEMLPGVIHRPSDREMTPGRRVNAVRSTAMFTTKAGSSHLLGIGEFFAMYLMVWSDFLWPHSTATAEEKDKNKERVQHYPFPSRLNVYMGIRKDMISEGAEASERNQRLEIFEKGLEYFHGKIDIVAAKEEGIEIVKINILLNEKTEKQALLAEMRTFIEATTDLYLSGRGTDPVDLSDEFLAINNLFRVAANKLDVELNNEPEEDIEVKYHDLPPIHVMERLMDKCRYDNKLKSLILFFRNMPKIRRTLANIATYMVFDDHEVTDDWHLNFDWVEAVYPTELGRRIMMNGLSAYAVFQAWGNTPDYFDILNDEGKKGHELLSALSDWLKADTKNEEKEAIIAKRVNLPFTETEITKLVNDARDGKIPISKEAVKWHFNFKHPKYEILFTDARTQRSFPGKRFQPSEHLSEEAIVEQVELTDAQPEFTLLVSPCNFVTIPYFRNWASLYGIPVFKLYDDLVNERIKARKGVKGLGRHSMLANDPDLADSWVPLSKAFENMLSRLASRAPIVEGKRRTRLVVISGDVHFSAVMRLQLWADKPFRIYADDPIQDAKANIPRDSPVECLMAHLVTSAFKNEASIFQPMQFLGYDLFDSLDPKEQLPDPEFIFGYHKKEQLNATQTDDILLHTRWLPHYRPSLIRKEPVMIPFHRRDIELEYPDPDWAYRIDAIRGERFKAKNGGFEEDPEFSSWFYKHFVYGLDKATGVEVIAKNNTASFDFHWKGEGKLIADMTEHSVTFEVDVDKDFPPAPFQVIIDEELIEVLEYDYVPNVGKCLKLRRGLEKTKKVAHTKDTKVVIRKTVNQTYWVVNEVYQSAGELVEDLEKEAKELNIKAHQEFPSQTPFLILIGCEIIEVGKSSDGKFSELKRGMENTESKKHKKGSEVKDAFLPKQEPKKLSRFVIPMEFEDQKYQQPSPPQAES